MFVLESFFEVILAGLCLFSFVVLLLDAPRRREYILHGVGALGAFSLTVFYVMLAGGIEPMHSSMELRLLVFRPSFVAFILGQGLIIANGSITRSRLGVWIQTRFNSRS